MRQHEQSQYALELSVRLLEILFNLRRKYVALIVSRKVRQGNDSRSASFIESWLHIYV